MSIRSNNKNKASNICADDNMLKEINEELVIGFFSLKGRTERLEFFKVYSMIFLFGIINYVYFIPEASNDYVIGFIIVYCLITLAFFPMTVRRLHDSNLNGGYYLIELVPSALAFWGNFVPREISFLFSIISFVLGIYFLYLVFRPSDPNANIYGVPSPPKKYGNRTINAICIGLFILIVVSGILSGL